MMNLNKLFLIFSILWLTFSYTKINDKQRVMAFYEEHSFSPILHVYYNRHFQRSRQFDDFLEVIEEVEYKSSEYSEIVLTDCEQITGQQMYPCSQIKRLNQNRMLVGYQPSNQFTNFGDKIMQSPPKNRMFDHHSDIYTMQEVENFINKMLPNFFKEISNTQDFQDFKKPKFSPKLIYATREGEVSQIIKQLGVVYFQKFDMAYVEDLTQSVINQLGITQFPCLLVLKFNYQKNDFQIFRYDSKIFTDSQYSSVKSFLDQHALKQRRNDYVFHLINMPTQYEIITVNSEATLQQALDRSNGWVILSQGPNSPLKLIEKRQEFKQYYEYIHFLKPEENQEKLYIYNPSNGQKFKYEKQLEYNVLQANEFQSNTTLWLRKDSVVLGVRQQFGHICTIIEKYLFKGLVQCFIASQSNYPSVAKKMGIQFKYGFISSANKRDNKVQGNQIKSPSFESVYYTLQYTVRLKVKEITDDFIQNPVKGIQQRSIIQSLCAQPYKKCIFFFDKGNKDKTKRQYLELEAVHYSNDFKLYQVDLACNEHLFEQIPQLQGKSHGLIAYHPRSNKYICLKAKMTRGIIQKFLKANKSQNKSLPFKQFFSKEVILNSCSDRKIKDSNQEFNDSQL